MFLSFSATAQTEHLKFLGIPLDGTLKEFHKSLVSNIPSLRPFSVLGSEKLKFDKFSYKLTGSQSYMLTLFEHNNSIHVKKNQKTGKTYEVRAIFYPSLSSESEAKEIWDKMTKQLMETYGKDESLVKYRQDKDNDRQTIIFTVLGTNGKEIGTIKAEYFVHTATSGVSSGSFSGTNSSFGVGTSSSLGTTGSTIGTQVSVGTVSGSNFSTTTSTTSTTYNINLTYTDQANAPQDASAGL